MKKYLIFFCLCALLVLIIGTIIIKPSHKNKVSGPSVVKIGLILPLSGDLAAMGIPPKNVIALVQQDLARKNLKNTYEFVVEDTAFDNRKTALAFQKMISSDRIRGVLTLFSGPGNVVAPLTQKHKIPHISIASDPHVAQGEYNFTYWTLPQMTAGRMIQYYKDQDFSRIAVFAANDAGILPLLDQLQKNDDYTHFHWKTFMVQPNEHDFRLLLAEAQKFKPDAYLVLLYGRNLSAFIKQFHDLKIDAPLTNIETFQLLDRFEGVEGAVFTDAKNPSADFAARYNALFPAANTYSISYVYDALMILVQAFENAETQEQAALFIQGINPYQGLVGIVPQMKEGIFTPRAQLKKIIDGKIVPQEE